MSLSTIPNPKPLRHPVPAPQPVPKSTRWWWVALPFSLFVILLVVVIVALVRYQDVEGALRQSEQESARQTIVLSDARRVLETFSAPDSDRVLLTAPRDRQPTAQVVYQPARGRLAMVASNLAPLTPNHVYQLWLNSKGANAPLPAGTFFPDERGHASLFMAMPPNLKPTGFQVTIEPAEGSLAPKTKAVLVGQIN